MKVLFFTADWCQACKPLKSVVEREAERAGVKVRYVDTDKEPETANHYAVRGLPTVIILNENSDETNRLHAPQIASGIMPALGGW